MLEADGSQATHRMMVSLTFGARDAFSEAFDRGFAMRGAIPCATRKHGAFGRSANRPSPEGPFGRCATINAFPSPNGRGCGPARVPGCPDACTLGLILPPRLTLIRRDPHAQRHRRADAARVRRRARQAAPRRPRHLVAVRLRRGAPRPARAAADGRPVRADVAAAAGGVGPAAPRLRQRRICGVPQRRAACRRHAAAAAAQSSTQEHCDGDGGGDDGRRGGRGEGGERLPDAGGRAAADASRRTSRR